MINYIIEKKKVFEKFRTSFENRFQTRQKKIKKIQLSYAIEFVLYIFINNNNNNNNKIHVKIKTLQ